VLFVHRHIGNIVMLIIEIMPLMKNQRFLVYT